MRKMMATSKTVETKDKEAIENGTGKVPTTTSKQDQQQQYQQQKQQEERILFGIRSRMVGWQF